MTHMVANLNIMTTVSALRRAFPPLAPEVKVDHLIIGGGAVGLAIGRELARKLKRKSTYVIERHRLLGQETSSRNSEVIHAGIYYPKDSLKTALCIRGRKLIYEFCRQNSIPHKKIGKLIISKSNDESSYLKNLYQKCQTINDESHKFWKTIGLEGLDEDSKDLVPLKFLRGSEAIELEPDLSKDLGSCLFSPETGIVDSHSFMEALENSINASENGNIVYGARVVRIDKAENNSGWIVQTATKSNTSDKDEISSVMAECVVNCAGLNAHNIYNQVLSSRGRPQLQLNFCKGNYFSYSSKKGVENIERLIYPTPFSNPREKRSFVGLGTHLTLDMSGRVKFGPDVEWLTLSSETSMNNSSSTTFIDKNEGNLTDEEEIQDFWENHLKPNDMRRELTYESVKAYLPGVELENFVPDYCGIRPKLKGLDKAQNKRNHEIIFKEKISMGLEYDVNNDLDDFFIDQTDLGFINLFGIESPGLTSCLGIAEYVEKLIREKFWMLSNVTIEDDERRFGKFKSKDRFSEVGNLDSWT